MKKRKIYHNFFLTILFILPLFWGCSENSALSDVEITDPSLIQPDVQISHNIDTLGNTTIRYVANLYDKNYDLIELKNGSVTMNGIPMVIGRTLITNAPYYYVNPPGYLNFTLNTQYTCTVTLADNSTYDLTVTSQNSWLNEFVVPDVHSKSQDMTIEWSSVESGNDMHLSLSMWYSNSDTSAGQMFRTIDIPEPANGSYTISKENFNTQEGVYYVSIQLMADKIGISDNAFRSGSSIYARQSISESVRITE